MTVKTNLTQTVASLAAALMVSTLFLSATTATGPVGGAPSVARQIA